MATRVKDEFTKSWIIENAVDVLKNYDPGVLTIRGLHYQLVSRGMTNNIQHYKRVVAATGQARWDGIIGFDAFSDRERAIILNRVTEYDANETPQNRTIMKKIYVASSWRNKHQQTLVEELRKQGYEVYDFKHPHGEPGFQWDTIDANWQNWTMPQYREALKTEHAQFGFNRDFDAMKEADICVLCLPCGRSAHLEAGWMKGAGKRVIAFVHQGDIIEPELMYNLLDGIALSAQDVEQLLKLY